MTSTSFLYEKDSVNNLLKYKYFLNYLYITPRVRRKRFCFIPFYEANPNSFINKF